MRLRGHYLAIASLGFAVIVHQILLNWISLTQGPLGIYGIAPPPAIAIPRLPVIADFRNPAALFYLVAGFALLVLRPARSSWCARRSARRSPRSARTRSRPPRSASMPPPGRCSPSASARRSAGAAGCFYASFVGTLVPDAFFVTESFTILSMVIVGGMGTLIGPVWGAILLTFLPEAAARRRRSAPRGLWRRRSRWSCCSCRVGSCRRRASLPETRPAST